jgi:hypothetical protein
MVSSTNHFLRKRFATERLSIHGCNGSWSKYWWMSCLKNYSWWWKFCRHYIHSNNWCHKNWSQTFRKSWAPTLRLRWEANSLNRKNSSSCIIWNSK